MVHERAYLARHLRILSLDMMQAGADICRKVDADLEPSWASLILHLEEAESVTAAGAATMMGVSHVHALKILRAMKAKGAVSAAADPKDGRSTIYRLTKKGRALVPIVNSLTAAAGSAVVDIESETGKSLFEAITAFRAALENKGWAERLAEKINSNEDLNK